MINSEFEKSLSSKKRTLSRFVARELVLDFVESKLDSGRQTAMTESVAKDKDISKDVAAVRAAKNYLQRLSEIQVAPELALEIESTRVGWSRLIEKFAWRNWPDVARWSVEAVVVAGVLAATVSLLPLNRMAKWLPRPAQELILAEVKPTGGNAELEEAVSTMPPPEPAAVKAAPLAPLTKSAAPVAPPPSKPEPVVVTKPEPPKIIEAPKAEAPKIVNVAKPPAPQPNPAVQAADDGAEKSGAAVADLSGEEGVPPPTTTGGRGPKGFVYRAFMSTSSLDATTDSVKALIESLGGTKAGQVDLGWKKATGTYFHFAVPEANYESLVLGMRDLGQVRIYKDPHWRLMPEGQIRIILFIEDITLKK